MLKAFNPSETLGRRDSDEEDLLVNHLDPFDRDIMYIEASKSLRRLAAKTQVLRAPENPHVRTRRSHTDEVRRIAHIISINLGLNSTLCDAITVGHDIGHTPYGHLGEKVISRITGKKFKHNVFGVVLAQEIENSGRGMNLSYETLEGILNHSRGDSRMTTGTLHPEYDVVMFADKIAYTFADINDAIRYGMLQQNKLPNEINLFGKSQRQREDTCMRALINESRTLGKVSFSECNEAQAFEGLKDFMYNDVYYKMDTSLAEEVLEKTYQTIQREYPEIDPAVGLALLTDGEVNRVGEMIMRTKVPQRKDLQQFGLAEIAPYIAGKKMDYTSAKLDWGKK